MNTFVEVKFRKLQKPKKEQIGKEMPFGMIIILKSIITPKV